MGEFIFWGVGCVFGENEEAGKGHAPKVQEPMARVHPNAPCPCRRAERAEITGASRASQNRWFEDKDYLCGAHDRCDARQ